MREPPLRKNMGILKYHPTSLISYERDLIGPWHAWKITQERFDRLS
jgi:hypothetical protein